MVIYITIYISLQYLNIGMEMNDKNIVFFVNSLDSGGIENYLLRFLQYKHSEFNKVYIYCKSGRGGQLESDYLEISNVNIIKRKHSYFDLSSYMLMYQFIKRNNISIICDFTGNFAGFPIAVAALSRVRTRVAFYRSAMDAYQQSYLKKLYSKLVKDLTFNCSTTILSNSEAAFDYFYKIDWRNNEKFKVILNGLNSDAFMKTTESLRAELNISNEAFVVGHTGRYNPAKNHQTILKVAFRLVKKYPNIYFLLCGNGVKESLNDLVLSEKLNKNILLFENRKDIPIFLNTLDCYFFPSTREGQPNALIEAMVMGLPFVASDIPPIRETVGDSHTLYPAMDVDALAVAIEKEYFDRKGRNIGLQQEMIKRFNYKERFDEFYQVLLND